MSYQGPRFAQAALSRGVALASSTACTLVATSVILRSEGMSAFAAITLISSMAALVPYADLGVGTAVVNATADWDAGTGTGPLAVTLRACLRLTVAMSLALVGTACVLWLAGGWRVLLGRGAEGIHDGQLAVTALSVVVACSVPLGLAHRALVGLSRVSDANLLQATAPLANLVVVLLVAGLDGPDWGYVVAPASGSLVAGALMAVRAVRVIGLRPGELLVGPVPRRVYRSALKVGLPSLVIFTASAASFQSARLFLSHLNTPQELASYALVAPLWLGTTSIVSVAGQTLWPHYRRRRSRGEVGLVDVTRHIVLFGGIAATGTLLMLAVGPVVIRLQTAGAVPVPWSVLAAAGALLLAQSLMLPLAMLLTAPSEWAVQAVITVGLAVVSAVLSALLCRWLGAAGAYLGGAIAVLAWQLPVTLVVARRVLAVAPAPENGRRAMAVL